MHISIYLCTHTHRDLFPETYLCVLTENVYLPFLLEYNKPYGATFLPKFYDTYHAYVLVTAAMFS